MILTRLRCPLAMEDKDGVPCLPSSHIDSIVERFDALSPYDHSIVPHLLKLEYPEYPDLRCFAVSSKRYVLYRWRPERRIQIIKATESALGAIIGRSRNETTPKLAPRVCAACYPDEASHGQSQAAATREAAY